MDNQVFDTYFKRTVWHSGCHIPSDEELCKMEDKCIERLIELSQTNIPTYKYTFSKYGNDVISRIGFFKKELLFEKNEGIEKLLFSAERFRKKLKNLDRNLYEQSFRVNIERGKGGITWANVLMRRHKAKQPVQPTNNTENKEVEPSAVEREEIEKKTITLNKFNRKLNEYGEFLSVKDLTDIFNVDRRTISNWEKKGYLTNVAKTSDETNVLGRKKRGAEKRYKKEEVLKNIHLNELFNSKL